MRIEQPSLLGLNLADRKRIHEIGYERWFIETCEKQLERLKKRRTENEEEKSNGPDRHTRKVRRS